MTATIRTGLIGFGLAGAEMHAPPIAADPRFELAAVATSRVGAVRARYPEASVPAQAEALIDDPGIDLVVIATPNELHAPLARAALEADKHVVVDKPFVADLADARPLIALARERARVLTVFHNRRWDGDFITVRDVLASGRLGEVVLAELCWDRFRPVIKRGWREVPGSAAGLLADLGPHLIDQALLLFGAPDAVVADVAAQRAEAAVDDWFDLALHYGRRRVRLSASTLTADPRPRFALHGTGGSFVTWGVDAAGAAGRLTSGDGSVEEKPVAASDWSRFYAGVADAILLGAPPPVDAEDAARGLELIALARRAAEEGGRLSYVGSG